MCGNISNFVSKGDDLSLHSVDFLRITKLLHPCAILIRPVDDHPVVTVVLVLSRAVDHCSCISIPIVFGKVLLDMSNRHVSIPLLIRFSLISVLLRKKPIFSLEGGKPCLLVFHVVGLCELLGFCLLAFPL